MPHFPLLSETELPIIKLQDHNIYVIPLFKKEALEEIFRIGDRNKSPRSPSTKRGCNSIVLTFVGDSSVAKLCNELMNHRITVQVL